MFAIVRTGGKQYRVTENATFEVERLPGAVGASLALADVLAVGDGARVRVGAPSVAGASVAVEVVEQKKLQTILVFKKRRRQNSRRRHGHRQNVTVLRVSEIKTGSDDGA